LKEVLRSLPEIEVAKRAVNKMKRETSTVMMSLTSNMLKALSEKALEHSTFIIQKFWKEEEDPKVWYIMLLVAVYKVKGETNDPSNWRGVCLKELTSKVTSSIVSTRLLEQYYQGTM
jgi:hypothetical protein